MNQYIYCIDINLKLKMYISASGLIKSGFFLNKLFYVYFIVHFGEEVKCHNCVVQEAVVLMLKKEKHITLCIVEHIPYESKSSFQLSVMKDRCCVF
jgi:hypothetical protein